MSHPAYQRQDHAQDLAHDALAHGGEHGGVCADITPGSYAVPYAVSFLEAHPLPARPRRRRGRLLLALASVAALTGGAYALRPAPQGEAAPKPLAAAPAVPGHAWLLDPRPVLGRQAYALGDAAPLGPALRAAAAETAAPTLAETAPAPMPAADTPRLAEVAPEPLAQRVPLPVQRPMEFRAPVQTAMQTPRPSDRRALPSTRSVFQAARSEEPSFLEKLFGNGAPAEAAPQALAYAGTEGESLALSPRRRLSPVPNPSEGVAVYDISARTVTLPSGERLEAHSGLGESMDNPSHVHLRMRGATPPGTYELTEREALFHGVRALRLNPVGGPNAIYGRVGLLTHTYMLGPKGASNGCISFRDYARFLQAYLRGEIRRVVVVAGNGDAPPSIGNYRIGRDRLGQGARRSGDG